VTTSDLEPLTDIRRPKNDYNVPDSRVVQIGPAAKVRLAAAQTQYPVFLDGEEIGFVASAFHGSDGKTRTVWIGSDGYNNSNLRLRSEAAYRVAAAHLDAAKAGETTSWQKWNDALAK
jgi:hypothetical protein